MISMYPKAEILFPPKLILSLKELRGPEWAELVTLVARLPETHPDALAFCHMMIELDGCLNCYAGSYKFMRGCQLCVCTGKVAMRALQPVVLPKRVGARRPGNEKRADDAENPGNSVETSPKHGNCGESDENGSNG